MTRRRPRTGPQGGDAARVEELADRLYLVVIHLLRRMKRIDSGLGLTRAQLSAITRLVSKGPMPLGDLAKAEGVRPPTMSRLVQRLEEDGLVLKRASPADARIANVVHTSRAVMALEEGRRRRVDAFSEQLGRLPDGDRKALSQALDVLESLSRDPRARDDTEPGGFSA